MTCESYILKVQFGAKRRKIESMAEEIKQLIVGVPKETFPNEHRVAVTADIAPLFIKAGMQIVLESGAGLNAGITDEQYKNKGVEVVENRKTVFDKSQIILQVRGFGANPVNGSSDLDLFRDNQSLISFFEPLTASNEIKAFAERGVNLFAIELLPRITRAQSMDALSSMATISGYKAVLLGAELLPKIFPMLMTAAGTTAPARVFVIGAGVAGLQAIATAKRLGAVVKAFDVPGVNKILLVSPQFQDVIKKIVKVLYDNQFIFEDIYLLIV